MLQTLTETALARRWAPSLFARLCSQLQDTHEVPQEDVDWLLNTVLIDGVPNPPLLEYLLTLAGDPKSVLPLETLVAQWASQSPETRTERDKIVMVYIARGISQIKVTPDRAIRLGEGLDAILDQAISECPECLFLLQEMGKHGILHKLAEFNKEWRIASEAKVRAHSSVDLTSLYAFDPLEVTVGDPTKVDAISYTPSKTFRLLWLDSAVSRLQHLESAAFVQQLDILWPNERMATLVYELTLTVFDGCAVSAGADGDEANKALWSAFLLKRLPLVLQDLLARDPALPTADSALSRVLTTMDKKIAEVVDASDLRASFIRTCIDLGVCDSAVLHVLHKTHTPRHEDVNLVLDGTLKVEDIARTVFGQDFEKAGWETSVVVRIVKDFSTHGPLLQKAVAQQLLRILLKKSSLAVRHHIALLCCALIVYPSSCDQLLLHVPLRVVIDVLLAHLDQAHAAIITQSTGYSDVGGMLAFIRWVFSRYHLDKQLLAESRTGTSFRASWIRTFLLKTPGEYATASDLNENQSQLLGLWVAGLFGGRGIGDAALQPFGDIVAILPALVGQVASAAQTGIFSVEMLNTGLEYFVQPGFAMLLVIVVDQLCHDLWLQRCMMGTLQILSSLLQLMQRDSARPAVKVVIAVVVPKISAALAWPTVASNPDSAVAALAATTAALAAKIKPQSTKPLVSTGSLATNVSSTVSALQRWQERSVGLPTINRQVFVQAISVLGPYETRRIIEKALEGGPAATEVEVALLVVYGSIEFGQSPNRDMLDAAGRETVTQIARDYAQRFKRVFTTAAQDEEAVIAQMGGSSPGPVVQEYPPTQAELDIVPEPTDIVLDAMEGDFSYGFDLDTGPMDLDELDSAMNFTDLLE